MVAVRQIIVGTSVHLRRLELPPMARNPGWWRSSNGQDARMNQRTSFGVQDKVGRDPRLIRRASGSTWGW